VFWSRPAAVPDVQQSISPIRQTVQTHSSKPAARCCSGRMGQIDEQTDGRTPCRYIDPAPHTMRAVPPKMATSIRDQRKSRPPATTITLYSGQYVISFLNVMRLTLISHTYRNSIHCVDPEMSRRVYMHCTHFRKKNPFTKLYSDDRPSRRRLPVGRAQCVFRMRLIGVKRPVV